jgi:hypothetical protein
MAHLRDIYTRNCYRCRGRATKTLHSFRNEAITDYCGKCAPQALREFEAMETREAAAKSKPPA